MARQNENNRKLAAILFADIVGYTALMQEGEGKAMSILSRFEQVTTKAVGEYRGDVIKTYGDGSLILFENTVDAVRCACAMQLEFQKEPVVSLRIGIHVGEVVHKGSDVFGDSVNLTSRIESTGMPGAVLISANAQDKIKNQEEFQTLSLGVFKFKNVRNPVEVFAISNEGLVIPLKSDLRNREKAHLTTKWHEKPILRIAVIVFLLFLTVGLFNIERIRSFINPTKISTENRHKRIAILSFDNPDGIADLQSYGNILSDWITRGLMETQNANVVNSANLRHLFQEFNSGGPFDMKFVEKSGIDLLLQGRYYLVEDRLIVTAEITDIASNQVVETFQVEGDRNASMTLLDLISEEIMSYWVVKDHVQFSQDPPKYEAYEEYLKGLSLYTVNAEEAIVHMDNAFRIDSSFFPSLFRAWALYFNMGQFEKALELQKYLNDKKNLFTNFESLNFEGIVAVQEHRFFDGARLNFQKYKLDPSDIRANFSAAALYNSANYPKKTLETLADYDIRLQSEQEGIISWRATLQAFANYRLGNYGAIQRIVDENSFTRMPHALADFHILALIRMDSIHLITHYYQKYTEEGVYGFTGMKVTNDQLLVNICSELMVTAKDELLREYAQKLKDWESRNKVIDINHDRTDIHNNMPFRQEETRGYAHFFLDEKEDAIKAWSEESIPGTNWPDILERASRMGHCYASIGDTTNANLQLQQIALVEVSHPELLLQKSYYRSRILSALGRHDEAIDEIEKSIRNGLSFFRIFALDRDPFLLPILDHPSFHDLVNPKG